MIFTPFSKNENSQKILLKLGFQHIEDVFYEPTGLFHPSYILDPLISRAKKTTGISLWCSPGNHAATIRDGINHRKLLATPKHCRSMN